MDVIKLTRELGAEIQKDERYLAFVAAREENEKDTELNELIGKINLIQMSYQQEASKDDANEQKLEAYDKEFREIYSQVMMNKTMQNYEASRKEVDDMMNYLTGILVLCVNGEDPMTCEPKSDHNCGGECSGCGSDCNH